MKTGIYIRVQQKAKPKKDIPLNCKENISNSLPKYRLKLQIIDL